MNRILPFFAALVAFAFTVLIAQGSLAAGFSQGNDFNVNRISGSFTMYCVGGPHPGQSRYVTCNADLWSPGLTDYFVGPLADADKVTLTATHKDGSQKSKDSKYDGNAGKSKSAFNLGIHTLTQKPLLNEGENKIHFALTKGAAAVTDGDFISTVTRGPSMACPHGVEQVMGMDCDFPQNLCNRYFERYDYCQ
jgi:hypothetical protein